MMADAQRERSPRESLIQATSRRLWEGDESELRILDICQETNLSTSVIYGHFRSRQGLIDASLLQIFSNVTDVIVTYLETAASRSQRSGSFVDTLFEVLTDPDHQAHVTRQRQMFLRVSATALSRPDIRPGFLEIYDDYIERANAIYDDLLARGLLSAQLTGRQWALFFEGQMLSRAFHGLSSNWDNHDDWLFGAQRTMNAAQP
jgi:AcrR family transcriptional regulator